VLKAIEDQSEFYFLYRSDNLKKIPNMTLDMKEALLEEVLNKVIVPHGFDYEIDDRVVVIKKVEKTFTEEQVLQEKTISGRVTDSSGAPLPGVTVVVKGTTTGTITSAEGAFSLSDIPENATLVFSFVGMRTQEISVEGRTTFMVVMEEETIGLEEVVAIGYGTMQKSDLTGSVAVIDNSKINQRAITSVDQGLKGQVSGVQVIQPSGAPGQTPFVRIRGINSIQYGNDPLWVVDGFPLSSEISFMNPNEIESITILKDASATAIYGSRGANGVILVTTKKGQTGALKVSYQSYYGAQEVAKKIDLMNAKEWATAQRTFWQRFRNGSLIGRAFPQSEIDQMGKGTDWQDEVFRTGIMQSHNISVSGGDEKTTYSVSGNYLNQEGIVINSKYDRGTFGINIEHKANSKFNFGANINSSYEYNQRISENAGVNNGGVIYGALLYAPTSPVRNEDGSYFNQRDQWTETGIMANISLQNPVQLAYEQASNYNRTHILGNFWSSYKIIEGLTAKISLGADVLYGRSNSYVPSYFISQSASNGTANISTSQRFSWVNENTLTYIKTFNEIHKLTALAGFTVEQAISESMAAGSTDFFTDITQYYNLGIGAEPTFPSSGYNKWSMASFLGRLNYDYANKYLITVSARYDGSSRFGENNRFGFFPSGAIAWRVNQEEFLKDINWLSNLKIRGSYGRTGNQDIPLYQNVQLYNKISSYVFGNSSSTAVAPGALVNSNLQWETTNQYDFGADFGFYNKLNFTVDYYYKKTNDLLFPVSIPRQGGYTSVLQNIGSVENKGFEFGVNVNLNKGDFSWNSFGNISFNKNKVLALANADRFFGPPLGRGLVNRNGGAATIIMVGEPIGVFWGNIFDGLWQTEEEFEAGHMSNNPNVGPGFENYRDIDGNGIFEEGEDETIIGNPHPDFEFGFNNTFSYKNFDLSFFINGVYGNDVFNANAIELTSQVNIDNALKVYKNAWDGPGTSNTIAKIDRPAGRSGVFPNRVSTQYIEDGSYVRLQNLTLGYIIPVRFLNQLRIYASVDNLVTITNYTGYNPEVSVMGNTSTAMGIDAGVYPAAKIYRFGLQVNF
jgi:TonB-linked SusC/RagA family outer membrane protein